MNIKNSGCRNVRKQIEVKNDDKYTTLYILLIFGSMDKTKRTPSKQKDYLGTPGEGLITSLDLKTIVSQNKNKNSRYGIANVSMKDISNIIKEFE